MSKDKKDFIKVDPSTQEILSTPFELQIGKNIRKQLDIATQEKDRNPFAHINDQSFQENIVSEGNLMQTAKTKKQIQKIDNFKQQAGQAIEINHAPPVSQDFTTSIKPKDILILRSKEPDKNIKSDYKSRNGLDDLIPSIE